MIGDVLEHYGIGEFAQVRYGWNRCRCPFHDDTTPSASVNYDEGRFYCFVCGINEDALGLIMRLEPCDFVTAKSIAKSSFGGSDESVSEQPGRRRRISPGSRDHESSSRGGTSRIRVRSRQRGPREVRGQAGDSLSDGDMRRRD